MRFVYFFAILLGAAALALQVRSYSNTDGIYWNTNNAYRVVLSRSGRIELFLEPDRSPFEELGIRLVTTESSSPYYVAGKKSLFGKSNKYSGPDGFELWFPHWIFLAIPAVAISCQRFFPRRR